MVREKDILYYTTSWSIYGRNHHIIDLPIEENVDDIKIPSMAFAFFDLKKNKKGYYVPFDPDPYASVEKMYTTNSIDPPDKWYPKTEPPYGIFGQIKKLRDLGAQFRFSLSIGGWSYSKYFNYVAETEASRKAFVDETLLILKKYPEIFDGVNIDWEYPSDKGESLGLEGNISRKGDGTNFVLLIRLLQETLKKNNLGHYKVSAATTAAPEKMDFPIFDLCEALDEVHVMTYDFEGSWSKNTGHHTNLYDTEFSKYSADKGIKAYLKAGVPASKLYLGAAFYTRGFANCDGMNQECSGVFPHKSWEEGVLDYKAVESLPKDYEQKWDDVAKAHYRYSAKERALVSYDSPRSIAEKCKYVWENDLAGIIVWETSGDYEYNHPKSLMKALYNGLRTGPPPDVGYSSDVDPPPSSDSESEGKKCPCADGCECCAQLTKILKRNAKDLIRALDKL